MKPSYRIAMGLVLPLLLAGCGGAAGSEMDRLDPKAPAATGLPATPSPDEPVPLEERPPFGLYAEAPTAETLKALSYGKPSPDQRFRAAVTEQGAWVARVDAAWLWQVQLPEPEPAIQQNDEEKAADKEPAPPAPTPVAVDVSWMPPDILLVQDQTGAWWRADPDWTTITKGPAAFQGKDEITFSPSGARMLYYTSSDKGRQLWVANADGNGAKLLGVNVAGSWSPEGEPVVTPLTPPEQPGGEAAGQESPTQTDGAGQQSPAQPEGADQENAASEPPAVPPPDQAGP